MALCGFRNNFQKTVDGLGWLHKQLSKQLSVLPPLRGPAHSLKVFVGVLPFITAFRPRARHLGFCLLSLVLRPASACSYVDCALFFWSSLLAVWTPFGVPSCSGIPTPLCPSSGFCHCLVRFVVACNPLAVSPDVPEGCVPSVRSCFPISVITIVKL